MQGGCVSISTIYLHIYCEIIIIIILMSSSDVDHFNPLTMSSCGTLHCLFSTVSLPLCDLSSSVKVQPPGLIPQEVFGHKGTKCPKWSCYIRRERKCKSYSWRPFNLTSLTAGSALLQVRVWRSDGFRRLHTNQWAEYFQNNKVLLLKCWVQGGI